MNGEIINNEELLNKDELAPVEAIDDQIILSEIAGGGVPVQGMVSLALIGGMTGCISTAATQKNDKVIAAGTLGGIAGGAGLVAAGHGITKAINARKANTKVIPVSAADALQAVEHAVH